MATPTLAQATAMTLYGTSVLGSMRASYVSTCRVSFESSALRSVLFFFIHALYFSANTGRSKKNHSYRSLVIITGERESVGDTRLRNESGEEE